MTFSLFTFIFLTLTSFLFFLSRKFLRPCILLAASLLYVAYIDIRSFIILIFCSLLVYLFGICIDFLIKKEKTKIAKILTALGVLIFVITIILLKYIPVILKSLPDNAGQYDPVLQKLILPIGFSYYMFQAISYMISVCKGGYKAEKNIIHFMLYMCFFPKFLSGPIERPDIFIPQIKRLADVKFFDERKLSEVFAYLLYGFFMKIVVADRLGMYVSTIFSGFMGSSSVTLIIGAFMYALQIYCDFAGYSALAVGIGKLYGIELTENFIAPYMATDIRDFWRRWHRSLSMWLRDYIYIPLGGNRKGPVLQCVNTMIVFIVCGLWHGNGLQFAVWGLVHGVYSVILILGKKYAGKKLRIPGIIKRLITFALVASAWIFFGADKVENALKYLKRMLTARSLLPNIVAEFAAVGFDTGTLILLICLITAVIVTDFFIYRKDKPFPLLLQDGNCVLRYSVYLILIVVIFIFGIYGPGFSEKQFMYMDF